jgi:hypothetical protein
MLQYIQLDTIPGTHTPLDITLEQDIIIILLETLMDPTQQTVLEILPITMQQFLEKTTMRDMDIIIMVLVLHMDIIQRADHTMPLVIITAHITALVITQLIIPLVIMMEIIIIQLTPHILVSQAITQQFIMQVIMLVHIQLLTTTPPVQLDQTLALAHHTQLVITPEHTRTPQLPLMSQQAR